MIELYHNDMSTCAQKVRMALAEGDRLAGDEFSLADLNYAPCMVRLDHWQLSWRRDGFRVRIGDWFNDATRRRWRRRAPARG